MNEKNLEYLQKQVKLTGYGDDHNKELREELKNQTKAFTLYHQQDYGKDSIVAALHFKKSESTDMVFFNRHTIMLKNEKYPDAIRQTFYIDSGKDNVTLKEGYNLLSGRAVEKNLKVKNMSPGYSSTLKRPISMAITRPVSSIRNMVLTWKNLC